MEYSRNAYPLGGKMNALKSKFLSSGTVLEGTDDVNEIGLQLLRCLPPVSRICAIVIANRSEFTLLNPRFYMFSGIICDLPAVIESGETGLIGSVKTERSAAGTVGVVTYEVVELKQRLQILWSVPFDQITFQCWTNISLGEEEASYALYRFLYYDSNSVTDSKSTWKIFKFNKMKAEVVMTGGSQCVLSICLHDIFAFIHRPLSTKHEFPNNETEER